jgi:hypothetical protein
MRRKTAFVIGSGIAGLSIAEILSRNEWKVILVEKEPKIGGEASLSTQNWLHTGWLYAALPYTAAMDGCYKSLHLHKNIYGHLFPEEVINLSLQSGKIEFTPSANGWFKDDRVHYLYALRTFDLSRLEKIFWPGYLKCVPFQRLRKLGYPVQPLSELPHDLERLLDYWEKSPTGHKNYQVIPSTDAKIETRRILADLLSVLSKETEIVTNESVRFQERKGHSFIRINGTWHRPDLIVLASGKAIREHLNQIGAPAISDMIKSIKSPILVLKNALPLPNFIRFTRNLPFTINHIKYDTASGEEISTVGDHTFYAVEEIPDASPFIAEVCARLNISDDSVAGRYYGFKTEYTGKLARRYNHALEKVNHNTFLALAGKFCQFPLLVRDFMTRMGLTTKIGHSSRACFSDSIVDLTNPEKIHRQTAKEIVTASEFVSFR